MTNARKSPLTRVAGIVAATVLPLLAALFVAAPPASAATLTEIDDFGANPSDLRMFLYVPDNVAEDPPILVAQHWCTGTGPVFHANTEFAALADQHGFIVIYPSVTRSSQCFDVSSPEALRRDGGSDPVGIRSMIDHTVRAHGADSERVFVTGVSSGAMMTNVMLANYPDVFAAGAAFAGVPFGCFATTDGSGWNNECSNGRIDLSPQEWGDLVRDSYPGYDGPRPRMQLWHGSEDDVLHYANFAEEIEQWTNVHGLGTDPDATDRPQPHWERTRYGATGDRAPVEAISVEGVGHNVITSGMAAHVITFFGLDEGTDPGPGPDPEPEGECRVTASTNGWNTGLTAALTITNTGDAPVEDWSLEFTLPEGQSIGSGWNATYSTSGGTVVATHAGHNATIAPGAEVGIGYQASHSGDAGAPTGFTLNGAECATG
ncbi:extracellular catalytic domain type 1 short-chain-length polyhydroxyalkanoate depolymerase [Nocardiopsis aegyptia]|uniref:Poly(Hydroxyalkanoate) depolymerase family esterase n=1 Tax=Nocardiopsis aegyptia TaxID=220378 RepID=A0A7Z0J8M7_9ACTN|nr:PHB depolymerase family esterase [Nocardiopsis aegyptia]NYJ32897.1 poly(hydroxyalkanoate) depolymerase family esterase [Nocardiopsis aegyptia]